MNYTSSRQKGNDGENRACSFLLRLGYTIISRNFRSRRGEIDVIALDGDTVVFVEVKTLPSGNPDILAHELNLRKQKRIIETSQFFLLNNRQYSNSKIRYDVIVIDMPDFEPVYHIQEAFSELT
ncbi:MAG: YraN family protein [Treponema sp.]|nr:YraN family protein [Treponema sp.]